MTEPLDIVTKTTYVLQAALAETPEIWTWLPGFAYSAQEDLDQAYERHFRAIEGKGCRYRRVKVEERTIVTVLP